MQILLKPRNVREAFSRSARRYENLSGLQQRVGKRLLEGIPSDRTYERILDVGMGTGLFTSHLQTRFPHARIIGIDFARGMVSQARQKNRLFQILQTDAERLPFRENVFDVMVSNLAYQWVNDLREAFAKCHTCLKDDGEVYLSIFTERTLEELFEALEKSVFGRGSGREGALNIRRLLSQQRVISALNAAGFHRVKTESQVISMHFKDMFALVRWLKATGANAVQRDFYVGKERLSQADLYYRRTYPSQEGITASFETLWLSAVK